ncbi:Gfo/Idh/MocA family protein [Neomegalonema perideroedes]|uniref:Gfo/Idh/MocA family protein n=1 Tax=Neomegalonema perideroedes TaxID=217219 RepID=UPI000376BB9B|nr:Gfo/Idh/MocA family oxidoreductase [Neomegalonema perideroedes]
MKIGIVGLGARSAVLVRQLRKLEPGLQVAGYVDPFPARLEALERLGFAPEPYDSIPDLVKAEKPDLLLICSPNHLHLRHVEAALESGAPKIFIEKPVAVSREETLALARLMARTQGESRLLAGLVLRYSPLYRLLREAQAKGWIGEVMSIEASEQIAPYHGSFFMRDWRRFASLSGGFMLEKCCHDLDLYQSVAGSRARRVASFGGRKRYLPEHAPAGKPAYLARMSPRWNGSEDAFSGEGDLVDYQTALVEYGSGATLAFHTNLNAPDEFRRFCVIGRKGMAEGDFIRNYFQTTDAETGARLSETREVQPPGELGQHYGADEAMIRDLLAHLRGELEALPVSVIDALEAGATALAMDEARHEGRVVDLGPFWAEFDAALGRSPPAVGDAG